MQSERISTLERCSIVVKPCSRPRRTRNASDRRMPFGSVSAKCVARLYANRPQIAWLESTIGLLEPCAVGLKARPRARLACRDARAAAVSKKETMQAKPPVISPAAKLDAPKRAPAELARTTTNARPAKPNAPTRRLSHVDALDEIVRIVRESNGIAIKEIVAMTRLKRAHVAQLMRKLRRTKRIHLAGDRRFARYASSAKSAKRASDAARLTVSGPLAVVRDVSGSEQRPRA